MATILVVDDESGVRDLLGDSLRIAGYIAEVASDGSEALRILKSKKIDLCIVDINMPNIDGFTFLETIRGEKNEIPVLLLSARDAQADVSKGLRIGADDYVRKPFSLEEILLRVAAILRRTEPEVATSDQLHCGLLSLDAGTHEVHYENNLIELSATEFHLLQVLLRKKNKLLTREQLLSEVWGIDFDSETSVLDTYISYLRKKIHRDGFSPIATVRGVGFKLVELQK
jgi:two-component system OmpR family response regulator